MYYVDQSVEESIKPWLRKWWRVLFTMASGAVLGAIVGRQLGAIVGLLNGGGVELADRRWKHAAWGALLGVCTGAFVVFVRRTTRVSQRVAWGKPNVSRSRTQSNEEAAMQDDKLATAADEDERFKQEGIFSWGARRVRSSKQESVTE